MSVSANYAQIPHAHSSNPPAPLSRQRTKKTKTTDKQTVSEKKIYIKERKLSFRIAAELRRQWRLISWFFQRRQREQPRWCSPLISAGRGAPCRAAAAPEPQVSPWRVGFHSAVALTVPAPSLIKIRPVSAYVHVHVCAGVCLLLRVCVCSKCTPGLA